MRISYWSSDVCSSDLGREVLVTARNEIEDRWGGASLPMGQCHGDWIPPNMSVARDGSYNLWDWELSDGDTPLGIDAMHFILRSEEHTSELQSLMRISYAVLCLKKNKKL